MHRLFISLSMRASSTTSRVCTKWLHISHIVLTFVYTMGVIYNRRCSHVQETSTQLKQGVSARFLSSQTIAFNLSLSLQLALFCGQMYCEYTIRFRSRAYWKYCVYFSYTHGPINYIGLLIVLTDLQLLKFERWTCRTLQI